MLLEGKRVLITGAGSGIGRALAVEAARRGMAIALSGRRHDALEATAALLGSNRMPLILPADITVAADRCRIVGNIAENWGALDVLINNAGIVEGGPLENVPDEALVRTFQTNVIAPIALTRDLMPALAAARPSRVVNVGSVFGDIPYPMFAAYSASKFALRGFSTALRREWKSKGIGVTYVAPGATQTDALPVVKKYMAGPMRVGRARRVARQIWHAVASDDNSVYAPGPERIYVLIQRVFPRVIDWALSRQSSSTAG